MRSRWLLAIGLVLSPGTLAAQEAPGAASRVEVVRVDVAVTDSRGRPVPGLPAGDFEVREDGALRAITNFTYVVVGASTPAAAAKASAGPAAKGTTGGPPTELPEVTAPAPAPPRAHQRRILAFVVDDLNLSRTSVARTRDMLKRFVEKSLQPDDLVGLFRTDAPPTTVALGADRDALLAAVAALRWNGESGREWPVDPIQEGKAAPVKVGRQLDRGRSFLLAEASLDALQSLVRALEPLQGRKSVLFLSDGLKVGRSTNAFDRLVDTANGANRESLVVYTIDPRGVTPLNFAADDFDNDPGLQQRIPQWLEDRGVSYGLDHDGLERLAEATGGLFIHDTDPGKGLAQALVDQSGYYLLGYAATAGDEPSFHRVTVTVRRPGLRVRARSGYWGGP
jgi:VWFA-related protein